MTNALALTTTLLLSASFCLAQRGQLRPVAPSSAPQPDAPITAGQIAHQVLPKYPKEARGANRQGPVVLDLTIEPSGEVSGIGIASGDLELAEEAVDAVREWRFDPYTQQGKPVRVGQRVTFDFDPAKKEAELEPLPPPTPPVPAGQPRSNGESVFRVGRGVSAPRATYMPNPPYTEKARKANIRAYAC